MIKLHELIIKTKYNTIHLIEEDYTQDDLIEILSQPYILSFEKVEINEDKKIKKRRKENDKRS